MKKQKATDNSIPASSLDSGEQNEVEVTGVVPEEEPSDTNVGELPNTNNPTAAHGLRRSARINAGRNPNPHNLPRSALNESTTVHNVDQNV